MAKISLRNYNLEVKKMVDRGSIPEAIAHCRHILKAFPKYIETYRLLGNAYIESQKYTDAADVLSRVLSAVPDDFLANLGMSIIREDEKNLDAAIWHMEHAYEIQPFNRPVQDELARLYGNRDGVVPAKIRLNNSALARMYARGELYPQAIAQLRIALAEDPDRVDLQVLLAKMYALSGQKTEAIELARSVLTRLPYCMEAHRILAEILVELGKVEDAKIHIQRYCMLDPYAAYATPTISSSNKVADDAIMIDRLDYDSSQEAALAPGWAQSVGVDWVDEKEPETSLWLEDTGTQSIKELPPVVEGSTEDTIIPSVESEEEALPDWMAKAGWTVTEDRGESIPPIVEELNEEETEGEIAEAEIPDWLKELVPTVDSISDNEGAPILSDLPTSQSEQVEESAQAIAEETSPEWMQELMKTSESETIVLDHQSQDTNLSWLEEIASQQDASQETLMISKEAREATLPSWLVDESAESVTPEENQEVEPLQEQMKSDFTAGILEIPSEDIESVPQVKASLLQDSSTSWISTEEELSEKQPENEGMEISPVSELTSDLTEPIEIIPADSSETPIPLSSQDTDEALAWLESLAARQGVDQETLITKPEDRLDIAPAWVTSEMVEPSTTGESDYGNIIETVPTPSLDELEDVDSPLTEPGADVLEKPAPISLQDSDAALAWLESLAARQGADQETLITRPEDRTDLPPAWVLEESLTGENVDESHPVEVEPLSETIIATTTESGTLETDTSFENITTSQDSIPSVSDLEPYLSAEVETGEQIGTSDITEVSQPSLESEISNWIPESKLLAEVENEPVPLLAHAEFHEPVRKPTGESTLQKAEQCLIEGNLKDAVSAYSSLIHNGENLEEVIHDLRDALYRYPVEIDLWQLLGDAYSKANLLQDALDAYTKAEELIK
ncbi:MAG TPA: tetratricopeptide repeat protein [Anaerolineaceae bacterium]